MSKKRPLTPQKLKKLFTILEREVLRSNVLNYSVYEKREPHFFEKSAAPVSKLWGDPFTCRSCPAGCSAIQRTGK